MKSKCKKYERQKRRKHPYKRKCENKTFYDLEMYLIELRPTK